MKIKMLCIVIAIISSGMLSANSGKWAPINIEFVSMPLNSAVETVDGYIIAVGDFGVIKKGTEKDDFTVVRGDYSYNNLYDIIEYKYYLFAFGENSTVLYSLNEGDDWHKLNISNNYSYISATAFDDLIYFCSKDKIFKLNPMNYEINMINSNYSDINKIFSYDEKLYIIGNNGLLAEYDPSNEIFNKIDLNTTNNISEIIARDDKIIVFPNKQQPIITDNYFDTYKNIISNNPMYFVKDAAWLTDSLIVAIAKDSELGSYHHAFSSDLLNNWVQGNYPIVPSRSMINCKNKVLITGDRGAIVKVTTDNFNKDDFKYFNNFLALGDKPISFQNIKIIDNKLYCFNFNEIFSYDLKS